MSALLKARLTRWWCDGPTIRTIDEARAFVDNVGFAVLFGGKQPNYPCLREISRDDDAEVLASGMGEDFEALWEWKARGRTRPVAAGDGIRSRHLGARVADLGDRTDRPRVRRAR